MARPFTLAEIAHVDDVGRQPYRLWNETEAWVWGLTVGEWLKLQQEARRRLPDGRETFDLERYTLCRFIDCVRDSGEPGARPIFNRQDHYRWLLERSFAIIDGAVALSMELSGETPAAREAAADFFDPGPESERPN